MLLPIYRVGIIVGWCGDFLGVLLLQLTFNRLAAHAILAVARRALVKLFLCMVIPCVDLERGDVLC